MPPADAPEVQQRFEANLDLVEIIARQVGRKTSAPIGFDDLLSYGREGLLDAARRFDESRGVPFRAYANYRVRGSIIDGLRAMSRLPRQVHGRLGAIMAADRVSEGALEDLHAPSAPGATKADAEQALAEHLSNVATALAVGLLAPTARDEEGRPTLLAGSESSPEEVLGQAELLQLVVDAMEELPSAEGELVRRHYLHGERFDHVAEELGLSKSWASRLHTRALGRLAKRLKGAV